MSDSIINTRPGDIRTESSIPDEYRLGRRPLGNRTFLLVLQGGFRWHNVTTDQHGIEWRDLPTVDLPPPE